MYWVCWTNDPSKWLLNCDLAPAVRLRLAHGSPQRHHKCHKGSSYCAHCTTRASPNSTHHLHVDSPPPPPATLQHTAQHTARPSQWTRRSLYQPLSSADNPRRRSTNDVVSSQSVNTVALYNPERFLALYAPRERWLARLAPWKWFATLLLCWRTRC